MQQALLLLWQSLRDQLKSEARAYYNVLWRLQLFGSLSHCIADEIVVHGMLQYSRCASKSCDCCLPAQRFEIASLVMQNGPGSIFEGLQVAIFSRQPLWLA